MKHLETVREEYKMNGYKKIKMGRRNFEKECVTDGSHMLGMIDRHQRNYLKQSFTLVPWLTVSRTNDNCLSQSHIKV
jgi:hypothetical protein